jgi:ribosomal protein S18 acetylase RimI-like enzyme
MTVTVTRFAGEFAALAAWTGEPEAELRADEDYHSAGREHWLAWDGGAVVGALHPWRSPDGRLRLYYDKCRPETYGPLAAAVDGECVATVDAADAPALTALTAAGFSELRRENEYEIPVTRTDPPVPAGIEIVTADQTELEPLMLLDCAIRADIPGSDGWQPDATWFREETYDSPFFDPQTYRVALDTGGSYVGLARVWKPLPGRRYGRLGCVGVLAGHRRRGLGRALIAQALAPLAGRQEFVTAEADTTNVASHALLTSFGARVTGGTVELHRPYKSA